MASTGYNSVSLADSLAAYAAFANADWGPQKLEVVWRQANYWYSLMVRGDSSIKTAEDIKGKRISYWSGGSIRALTEGLLAYLGITEKDVTLVPASSDVTAAPSVAEGRVDVGWVGPEQPTAIEAAQNPKGIRFISLPAANKEGWKRFVDKAPMASPGVVKRGVKEGYGVEAVAVIIPMVTYPNVDPELTYRLAKFFAEAYPDYKDLAIGLEDLSVESMRHFLNISPFPVHPGAIKYLREKGIWTAQDDKNNQESLDLMDKYNQAFQAAMKEATSKNIKIDYQNTQWMDLWNSYLQKLPVFKFRV